MRKKRLFGVLLIISALIVMMLPVSEADAAASASDFVIEGGKLLNYKGTSTDVSVPATVEVICAGAFEENTVVKRIVVPNSVKKIDAYAFWGCERLETVSLGTGLTEVGDYVFAGCTGLQKITLPSNITSIGAQAFGDCTNLREITIPSETRQIHETAFDGCSDLTFYCAEGSVAAEFAEAFHKKQSEQEEYEDVPNYGQGDGSGSTASPEPAITPADPSDREIGRSWVVGNKAFVFLDLGKGNVIESKPEPVVQPNPTPQPMEEAEQVLNGKEIAKNAIVDDQVIADQAYYKKKALDGIKIPNGIVEIGQFAFARSALQALAVPEGVEKIDFGAFYYCEDLKTVRLPESLMCVEPKAFERTGWVEDFYDSGDTFLISGGTLIAYHGSDRIVSVPEGVRVIAADVFANHEEIGGVRLPDSLKVIGEGAFENCTGLVRVIFGTGVEQIKDRAFAGCETMQSVSLPASVKEVGLKAFDGIPVTYEGDKPEATYEVSATRLSNEAYRELSAEEEQPGVTVEGLTAAGARLAGAGRRYLLTVERSAENTVLSDAWKRVFAESAPKNMICYELRLTDSGKIPLTKLGRNRLTVVIPLPEELSGQKLSLVTVDRNGQLEVLSVEKVALDGKEAFRFDTNFVSVYGLIGTGESDGDEEEELREMRVELNSLSAFPGAVKAGFRPAEAEVSGIPAEAGTSNVYIGRVIFAAALLMTGMILFLASLLKRK